MSKWQSEIYRGELAQVIKTEYRNLLAVKKSEQLAEDIIIAHFIQEVSPGSEEEGHLWCALALRQWELGRLSEFVKKKAMFWIQKPISGFSKETLGALEATLRSPQLSKKQITLPSWVKKCPWPVGSLLAYRIISSEHENVRSSHYWKKYVLLRIIQINSTPVTFLAPDTIGSESMLVGLYDWYGDEIPNCTIVDSLEFTPIVVRGPSLTGEAAALIRNISLDGFGISKEVLAPVKFATTEHRVETCCCLDWKCAKGINHKEVFTYMGCDTSYQYSVPTFFKTDISSYSFAHSIPFDSMLCNRLRQLYEA